MLELSICVLTRDNCEICKTTISGILNTDQDGFELLVIDASKDKKPLQSFITELGDQRVKHVHVVAKDRIEHWNQAIPEASGHWLTFIADTDYFDPKAVNLIKNIGNQGNKIDTIGWNKISYDWPEHRSDVKASKIASEPGLFSVDKKEMRERFFGFKKEGLIPFSIYHGLVTRELAERICNRFGNTYFEHPCMPYEFGFKVIAEADKFAFSQRSLSVICELNEELLSEATNPENIKYKKRAFYKDIEIEDNLKKFPFMSDWSPRLFSAIALNWLREKYGSEFEVSGWKQNYVKRREDECNGLHSQEQFAKLSEHYAKAVAVWMNGKFTSLFKPKFNPNLSAQKELIGCFEGQLFIDKNALGANNPAEFYTACENFLAPVESTGLKIKERS